MSNKNNPAGKKIVKTKGTTKAKYSSSSSHSAPMLFGKRNYMFMGIGFGLIIIGCLLMLGGGMPDQNTWDDSLIYSFRRITLAPIVILAGLIMQIYAIFTRSENKVSLPPV